MARTADSTPAPAGANAPARHTRRAFGEGLLAALVGTGVAAAVLAPDPDWSEPAARVIPAGPDAALIAACARYVAAVRAYNARGGHIRDASRDPLWRAVSDLEDRIEGMPARTLEGVVAKARVVAFLSRQPDGTEDFAEDVCLWWPEAVVRDLLAVAGGERVA